MWQPHLGMSGSMRCLKACCSCPKACCFQDVVQQPDSAQWSNVGHTHVHVQEGGICPVCPAKLMSDKPFSDVGLATGRKADIHCMQVPSLLSHCSVRHQGKVRCLGRPREKSIEGLSLSGCIVMHRGRPAASSAARQMAVAIKKGPSADRGHLRPSGRVVLPGSPASMFHTTTASQATTMCCRRAAAAYVANAAAAHSAKGGSTLHHCPEMMLQFVVQHLAHHPDFPIMQVSNPHGQVQCFAARTAVGAQGCGAGGAHCPERNGRGKMGAILQSCGPVVPHLICSQVTSSC